MANLNLYPKKSPAPEEVTVHMTLALDGTNDATLVEGNYFVSAAHTATGKYRIKLSHKFMALKCFSLDLQAATAVDLVPQLAVSDPDGSVNSLSGANFDVVLLTGATATNAPAASGNKTYLACMFVFRNSTEKGA